MAGGSGRVFVVLAATLLGGTVGSGCLADDFYREPFRWRQALEIGEGIASAQAFAEALQDLGARGQHEGDKVYESVDDLPENVVFQNARAFLERNAPGSGEQSNQTVHVVTDNASMGYTELSGRLAEAYSSGLGTIGGTAAPTPFDVDARSTRVRLRIDAVLVQTPVEEGLGERHTSEIIVRVSDPAGRERGEYEIDSTRVVRDQFFVGTYGGRNTVREHLGGTWSVEVIATGEGSYAVTLDVYEPRYGDWEVWQFWKADPRRVAGE